MAIKRRRTKSNRQRVFIVKANAGIAALGGTKHPECDDTWQLQTQYGELSLRVQSEHIIGVGTVFTHFAEPVAAHPHTGCNPYSGKWNFHYLDAWTPDTAVFDFEWQLRKVLGLPAEGYNVWHYAIS